MRPVPVQALGDRQLNSLLDVSRVVEHLLDIESEDRVPAQSESGISAYVATPISRRAVVRETIDLDAETLADHRVERVAVDPHLLSHLDADPAHE